MEIENELQRIAEQYQSEGYSVVTHPEGDHLKGFPGDLGADILATRGTENVLVQVKRNRAEVEADRGVSRRAELVNSRPGWRYDLVVLERETPVQRVIDKGVEPSEEQFRGMLQRARAAKAADLNEMALSYAWAALEAAMRQVRDDVELYGKTTPTELLRTLYGNGAMTKSEFDRARIAWGLRTQAVHGFVTSEIDSSLIEDIISLASKVKGVEDTHHLGRG